MDPLDILKHPHITEKNISMVEKENKLVFIVDRRYNKQDIKQAIEKLFEVKVEKVNTIITRKGKKKAFIKLKPKYSAADVAVKLGIV
ncbi:MAG: 50S ribosomal protein L23 [Candidatus Aenigmarchaeota archaeon]|nr:50S ribosomal protein L23 [Candidatus Aenigmarchaeota archaeon]